VKVTQKQGNSMVRRLIDPERRGKARFNRAIPEWEGKSECTNQ